MKKILYLFILTSLAGWKQGKTQIRSEIKNTKTAAHVNIPGTRVYMIPPPGFTIATTFTGLQKGEIAIINVYDLVGGNMATNSATFTRENFENKGITVLDFRKIKVHGFAARYIQMRSQPGTTSYGLVFGDSTFSDLIMTACAEGDEKTGNEVIAALNSIYYEKVKKIDPFAAAGFSLDDRASRFKFFNYTANAYFYTLDGKDNAGDSTATQLLFMRMPFDDGQSMEGMAGEMLDKTQGSGAEIIATRKSSESVNGYPAYHVEVDSKIKGKPGYIYFYIIRNGDKAILIEGISKKNKEADFKEFEKLVRTIRF